jgi:hypothetical protein
MTRLLAALTIALVVLGPAMARPWGEQALKRAMLQSTRERAIQQGARERAIQQKYEDAQRFLSAYLQRGMQQNTAHFQQGGASTGTLFAAEIGTQLIPAIPGIIDAISRASG